MQKHQVQVIIHMIYDHPLGVHKGVKTIVQKIRKRYYWKTVYQNCKEYVKTYKKC